MALSQDAVLEKLKNVIDPELFVNIVDLGLIYEIKLSDSDAEATNQADDPAATVDTGETAAASDEGESGAEAATPGVSDGSTHVHIDMTMTSPACPAGPQLIAGAKREVGMLEGVRDVEVRIVLDPPWTPDRMTEDAKDQLGIF